MSVDGPLAATPCDPSAAAPTGSNASRQSAEQCSGRGPVQTLDQSGVSVPGERPAGRPPAALQRGKAVQGSRIQQHGRRLAVKAVSASACPQACVPRVGCLEPGAQEAGAAAGTLRSLRGRQCGPSSLFHPQVERGEGPWRAPTFGSRPPGSQPCPTIPPAHSSGPPGAHPAPHFQPRDGPGCSRGSSTLTPPPTAAGQPSPRIRQAIKTMNPLKTQFPVMPTSKTRRENALSRGLTR